MLAGWRDKQNPSKGRMNPQKQQTESKDASRCPSPESARGEQE